MISQEEDIFSVTIDLPQGERLGLVLAGGVDTPIEIKKVQDGSVASLSGLTGGLQIMSVNNIIFAPTTTHHDAIMALTSSSVLNISVKRKPGSAKKRTDDKEKTLAIEAAGENMDDKEMKDMSYGVKKTDIGSTLSIYLQKRHALNNFHLVEVTSSLWLAGWNQKEPALMNKFHVGDQLLSVNGQPVTTVAEANTIMEMTPSGVELLLKRMPLAAEYKMHREKEAEDWGMQIRQNRLVDVIHGGIAWTAGLQPFSAEFAEKACSWAITQVNKCPVSVLCRSTDVIWSKINSGKTDALITLQPSEFVNILSNSLLEHPHYEDFVARS
ncbi:hypothetical protein ACHWQZ_G006983 [Mnemiopsis leidyi]